MIVRRWHVVASPTLLFLLQTASGTSVGKLTFAENVGLVEHMVDRSGYSSALVGIVGALAARLLNDFAVRTCATALLIAFAVRQHHNQSINQRWFGRRAGNACVPNSARATPKYAEREPPSPACLSYARDPRGLLLRDEPLTQVGTNGRGGSEAAVALSFRDRL
jgi:hypothetical protein